MSNPPSSSSGSSRRSVLIGLALLAVGYGAGVGTSSMFGKDSGSFAAGPADVYSLQPNAQEAPSANGATTTTALGATTVPASPESLPLGPPAPGAPPAAFGAVPLGVAPEAQVPAPQIVPGAPAGSPVPAPPVTTTTTIVSLPGSVNQLPPGAQLPPSDNSPTLSIEEPDDPGLVLTTIPVRPPGR